MTVTVDAKRGSDFAGLCRQVRAAGLLERRRGQYTARIAVTGLAFAGLWWTFAWVGDSWYQTMVAAALGVLFTQIGFLGHDGGHQQVARSRRANDTIGVLAGDLLVGLSYGWWVDKHSRHHAHPNREGYDPDIGDGVLAFTTTQVACRGGAVGRLVARHQAWLFFPLLTLEGLNLHVASLRSLLQRRSARYRRVELALFTVHVVGYLGAVFLVLSPVKALVFIAIHQGAFGLYMGCSFAPNHKGMPTIPEGADLDFLRRQVLTSRNVRGGWFTDLLLGGLNYQVEHHLFPNMPRPSLRRAQALVRAYCHDHRISYTETSLVGSYAAALRHLHALGAPLRVRAQPNVFGDLGASSDRAGPVDGSCPDLTPRGGSGAHRPVRAKLAVERNGAAISAKSTSSASRSRRTWAGGAEQSPAVTAHRRAPGSGGPGESHPRAPTDPGVNLSIHRALVILVTRQCGPISSA